MNIFMIILLTLVEIILAGLSITRKSDVKSYSLIRMITNFAELLICLVMLLTKEVSFGLRFSGIFVLLIIRLVIAGIVWLIKRKNENAKKYFAIIISAVFSIVLFILSLIPSFIFGNYTGLPTSGKYDVNIVSAILIDENRIEAFETDGSYREVPVYVYYPETSGNEKFPLVFFSHGAFGYYQSNTSTYMELASNGYVVVSVEHPYHSLFTKDTNGQTIIVDQKFIQDVMLIQNNTVISEDTIYEVSKEWVELRVSDMNFAIDTIKACAANVGLCDEVFSENTDMLKAACALMDTEKIGAMGHSLGGATSVTLGRTRNDIDAAIDFDGTMLGEILGVENGVDIVYSDEYPIPLLEFSNEPHYLDKKAARENNENYVNNVILDNAKCGYDTCIMGSGHMNYTDLPLFAPPLAKMLGIGNVDPEKCIVKMNELTVEFFDCFLKGEGEFTVEDYYEFP